ncbi:hypothetical protein SOCEGT47_070050 [Sorangium cellulosum]|uniref:Uncharacterized protein n=1 Tax=Sorangium cellulosum TaxID=56 RepID=A0A4V0NEK0_SORCE|nr:DUF5682 family protein [Sorangium cellulosum]AUX26442.1 hypothetical protein SOCEGT47_070050 [Sorangium cellulosum]
MDLDLDRLAAVHLFPVRHHSPRSSAALRAYLDEVRPKAVFVEGPSDANALLEALVDPRTVPPVAILGYRTDGAPASSLWPFAAYSPEYVALKWAFEHGARAELIDVPVGVTLAPFEGDRVGHDDAEDPGGDARAVGAERGEDGDDDAADDAPASAEGEHDGPHDAGESIYEACARARGFRSFEEFWEASFEAPRHDPRSFREALLAYADLVRGEGDRLVHRARDAYMARRLLDRMGPGLAPHEVVAVLGAAHAAAFAARDVDPALEARLPAPAPCAATLIPFSFPRLSEQLGYGAGNRAPQYYQRAHDAGGDFRRATLEVLIDFTEHLRLRGFMASLADTIEAFRLAVALAEHRGKAEPGLDEVREATIATLCRGDATHVDGFLWPAVIGRNVGRVADRIGKNSLQEEFWREVRERRLPATDAPESFRLSLTNEVEVGTSVLLHRLRIAKIPFAAYAGTRAAGRRAGAAGRRGGAAQQAPPEELLGQLSETWEAQWTPATDVALVEKIVLGDTLEQVATRLLEEDLAACHTTGEAADVLLNGVLASSARAVAAALRACDQLAAGDGDLPSLARACRAFAGLVSFGSSRSLSSLGDGVIAPMLERTFARAVLRVHGGCTGNDEAVAGAKEALRTLHDVALSQPLVDRGAWLEAARGLVDSEAVNPTASGLACGLLYLAQAIDDAEVARVVGLRLGGAAPPEAAASFLAGFLEVNALVLVKSRPVVEALDAFLGGIAPERFKDALPVLRRAFSGLGATERRYLLENVLATRKLGDKARAAQAVLLEKDREKLKEMSDELAQAMDDLDELL